MNGVAAPELTVSGTPSTAARVLTFVLCVVSAVTLVGLRVAVKVPSVNLTREGVTVVVFSSLLLGTFVSKALFFLTTLTNTSFGIKYRGLSDATWLADKDKEKIQTSMRAVHILRVSWEQGGVVPVTASWPAPQAVNVSFLPT